MAKATFLYVTAPDSDGAEQIARALIKARLAACVNLIPGMKSIYRWRDAVETAAEVVMIVKTTADAAPAARDLICASHPYETPCVIGFSTDEASSHREFLQWIAGEVGDDRI